MERTLTTTNLPGALDALMKAGIPVLIQGAPGIGKTDIVRQTAAANDMDVIAIHAAMLDPTDVGGLPVPDGDFVTKKLDHQMRSVLEAKKPTVLFFDEIGQGSPSVQAALAPIILERQIGGKPIPAHVYIACATNRRTDYAGAHSILSHIISRVCVLNIEVEIDAFRSFAAANHFYPAVPAFLKFRPQMLHQFDPKTMNPHDPYACPRAWERVSRLAKSGVPTDIAGDLFAGLIGEGAAAEFAAYLRTTVVIDIENALKHPAKVKIPKDLALKYALAVGCSFRASAETAAAIITIAERFVADKAPEFAAMMIRDAFKVFPGFGTTDAWQNSVNGTLQETIRDI